MAVASEVRLPVFESSEIRTYHLNQPNADQNGSGDVLALEAAGDGILNGDCDDKAHMPTKGITAEQDSADRIVLNGNDTALPSLGDDANLFRQAAKSFLAVHREEIAQRDAQIQALRTELLRIQKTSNSQEDSDEHRGVQETHIDEAVEAQPESDVGESKNPHQTATDGEDASLDSVQRPIEGAVGVDILVQDDTGKV